MGISGANHKKFWNRLPQLSSKLKISLSGGLQNRVGTVTQVLLNSESFNRTILQLPVGGCNILYTIILCNK